VAEATIQALKEAMQVLEDKEVAAAKTIEDLQVKERKLKQLLTKQKAVIKSKDDEAKASQEERFKALELSSELNSRGDALRRVTDELDAVKASLAEETSKRSQAEGHFAAAQRSLASAEASAADSAKRILTSDTALADMRSQFDDYKRRTAAMLERGASSEESDRTKAISGATQDMEEFNAYKKRSSEALRQVCLHFIFLFYISSPTLLVCCRRTRALPSIGQLHSAIGTKIRPSAHAWKN
jgi:chromosome segregation ATPase